MCGFAGVVTNRPEWLPDDPTLDQMGRAIAHRGPDAQGTLEVALPHRATCAKLVHRRLAVLDPLPRANQPLSMTCDGRTVHLVFNGEIYNFRELRSELTPRLPGLTWQTTGDTEVLLAAYLAWGPACVERLVGMFAFAVLDEGDGSLLLARDRLGQKPLYYGLSPDGAALAFASEVAALTPLAWTDTELDDHAVIHYLCFNYTPLEGSIYRGIRKLLPGHVLRWSSRSVAARPHRYWTPPPPDRTRALPPAEAARCVRSLVNEAVCSQLVADVPLGCFLSGGIDSAVVASCAQSALKALGGCLRTFTVAFDDPAYDESLAAARVAHHLGTHHVVLRVGLPSASQTIDLLAELARAYAEPFADSSAIPTWLLCQAARAHVTVALAGDGGDELFGGYDRYHAMAWAERYRGLWRLPALSRLGQRLASGPPKARRTRVGRFLASAGLPPGERYEAWMRLFPPGLLGAPAYTGRVAGRCLPGLDDVRMAAMALDRETYLDGDLLTKVDRASMHFALEVRAPMLDHRLVEWVTARPAETLFPPGVRPAKALLRRAFAGSLPRAVFDRPKRGFAVPIGAWFRERLADAARDLLASAGSWCAGRWGRAAVLQLVDEHVTAVADHGQRLFALIMLELWRRECRPSPRSTDERHHVTRRAV